MKEVWSTYPPKIGEKVTCKSCAVCGGFWTLGSLNKDGWCPECSDPTPLPGELMGENSA